MVNGFQHIGKIAAEMVKKETTIRKTRSKYRAEKTTTPDGIKHDSKREAQRWADLQTLERAGVISNLSRQVKFPLEGRDGPILTDSGKQQRNYVADFHYYDMRNGAWVIEDAKGFATKDYKLKKAILAAQGVEIIEV